MADESKAATIRALEEERVEMERMADEGTRWARDRVFAIDVELAELRGRKEPAPPHNVIPPAEG